MSIPILPNECIFLYVYFTVYKYVYTYGVYIFIYLFIYLWWCVANVMEPVFPHSAPPSLPRRTSAGCPGETARGQAANHGVFDSWTSHESTWRVKGNEHDVDKQNLFHPFEQGLYHLFMVYYCSNHKKVVIHRYFDIQYFDSEASRLLWK